MGLRLDNGVGLKFNGIVNRDAIGVNQGYACLHPPGFDAPVEDIRRDRELLAIIDALNFRYILNINRIATPLLQQGNRIGEVILILGIAGAQQRQNCRQIRPAKAIDTGVDSVITQLRRGAIPVLDDIGDPLLGITKHPSVARGIRNVGRKQGHGTATGLVLLPQVSEGFSPQQRHIAIEHN